MKDYFNPNYPSTESLRQKAKTRLPRFAFEYVDGGCHNDIGIKRNTDELRALQLTPYYLKDYGEISTRTELFGHTYDAPFGVSPVGLQGLIWPQAPQILATAAQAHNVPFILSTVSTASIETIAELTDGRFWFQLYHPVEDRITDDLLTRCKDVGIKTLVLLADVPSFSYRPKEIKNGLVIPPRMTLANAAQITTAPAWAVETLRKGQPHFRTLSKYMTGSMNLQHLGQFMDKTFNNRLNEAKVKRLREKWQGNLVLKGVSSVYDAQKAIEWGLDGIIVSNHGGRQLDCARSSIGCLHDILTHSKGKITTMFDSGIREGADIVNALAMGADFTFLGRTFMYSVGALGSKGGHHAMNMLKKQIQQVMEQLCCDRISHLPTHLDPRSLTDLR